MPMNDRRPNSTWPNTVNRQPQKPATPQWGQQAPTAGAPQQSPQAAGVRSQTPPRPGTKQQQNRLISSARPQNTRQASPLATPARMTATAKRPSSQLILVIIALALSVIGAVLVAIGVFVLKNPKPETVDASSPGSVVSDALSGNDHAAGMEGSSAGTNMETAARMPSGEDLFMPLASLTSGGDTSDKAEPPASEITGEEGSDTVPEPSGEGETAPEDAAPEDAGTAPEDGGAAGQENDAPPASGDTPAEPDDTQNIEPTEPAPVPTVKPAQEAGPIVTPLPSEEKSGFGAKQIVTIIGTVLVGVGTVLALVAGFLQHTAIVDLGKRLDSLQTKLRRYEHDHRDPTFAEKLKYAFEQVPTLTLEEAKARTEARPALAPAPAAVPVYQQPMPAPVPQPAVSPAEQADAEYNQLLNQGGQAAAQAMIAGGSYSGAGIDINGCLYAYQSGQDMPYRVVSADKGWGVQYFVVGAGGMAPQLYPNPYVLEQNGLANAQNLQYILHAFNITVNGTALTPQTIGTVSSGLHIRHVAGAHMDAQNVVVQKGQIEMG